MIKKRIVCLGGLFLFLALFVGPIRAGAGPRLYLDPSSSSPANSSEFDVLVEIDPGNKEAMAADALINFDNSRLEVKQVADGGYFSGFDYNIENDNGRMTIYSFSTQALQTKSEVGTLATITFKAIAEGPASVSFLCQSGNDSDSAIWDAQGNDLIDCAANGSGTYTIGSGAGEPTTVPTTAPTTAPTSVPGEPTATPSQLPETGIETPLLISLLGGGIMVLLGTLMAL